jgi:hypothetical protein
MSSVTPSSLANDARALALDCAWAQWAALTHLAAPIDLHLDTAIVDPEALVLLSLLLWDDERRLRDLMYAFATSHAKLLSVHRIQTLGAEFPGRGLTRVAEFASWARHPSWKRLATSDTGVSADPLRRKDLGPLRLAHAPALQLRLRLAFGVGLKTDLLTHLMCRRTERSTLAEIAQALGYTEKNSRIAADDLVDAGFVERDDYSARTTYRFLSGGGLFGGARNHEDPQSAAVDVPQWYPWYAIFPFLAHLYDFCRRADDSAWSTVVVDSKARDFLEAQYPRLIRSGALPWAGRAVSERPPLDELASHLTQLRATISGAK